MSKEFSSKLNARFWYFIYTILGHISTKKLVELRYKRRFGRKLDWENPQTLNEKILWLKQYTDTTEWTRLADKYRVREFVEERGLSNILVELYGKWDRPEDIEWDKLPDQLIIKLNNGSGDVFICKDKNCFDKDDVTKKLKLLLSKGFGVTTAEPHYRAIKPCIIAEELLDNTLQCIKSTSLVDFKIWCLNGEPVSFWVCHNRNRKSVEVANYDINWKYLPEVANNDGYYESSKTIMKKPASFDEMIRVARQLSKGFPAVRVDLYEVNGKVYFGEMTFSSNFGLMEFYTDEYQKELGEKLDISDLMNKKRQ